MDRATRTALDGILADLRDFHATDGGTDRHPDWQYLTEDIEERITALLAEEE